MSTGENEVLDLPHDLAAPYDPEFRIVEIFESLQGEGYNTGMPAIFIRLGRCDLACSWCDTDYLRYEPIPLSQILHKLQAYRARSIIITGGEPTIHPRVSELLDALKARGYYLCIETNGLHQVPEQIDYIATSPKACYAPRYAQGGLTQADEVRIVVDVDGLDLGSELAQTEHSLHAPSHLQAKLRHSANTSEDCLSVKEQQFLDFAQAMAQKIEAQHYYLSPLEQGGHMNIHQTIRLIGLLNRYDPTDVVSSDVVSNRPPVHWQLSVQTHKWAGIE